MRDSLLPWQGRRSVLRRALLAGVLLSISFSTASLADDSERMPLDLSACSEPSRARLEWLVPRLDSRELYGDIWWKSWTGFYATGIVYQSVQASIDDDDGKQADAIVGAVKALIGTTRLLWVRPTARLGADPLLDQGAPASEETCLAMVSQGEDLLQKAAKESQRRWDWKPHTFNVALNLAGALIATQAFHAGKGWESMGIGIAVGEAMIFSHPWQGRSDLEEYEAAFGPPTTPQTSWSIQPYHAGLRLQVNF
jgi:hypothetical protein